MAAPLGNTRCAVRGFIWFVVSWLENEPNERNERENERKTRWTRHMARQCLIRKPSRNSVRGGRIRSWVRPATRFARYWINWNAP